MLTIFGKKKKDDSSLGLDTGTDNQTSPPPYTSPQSMQPQPPPPIIPQGQPASQSTQSLVNNPPLAPPNPPSARMTTSGPMPVQLSVHRAAALRNSAAEPARSA